MFPTPAESSAAAAYGAQRLAGSGIDWRDLANHYSSGLQTCSAVGNPREKIRIEPVESPVPEKTPAPVETPSEVPEKVPA